MPAQITALPTPPSTNDPSNFNTRADAFLGQMPTFVTEANAVATEVGANAAQAAADRVQTGSDRAAAAASAASALNAPGTNGTSTTSLTIGTGARSFVTQAGKAWSVGQSLAIANTVAPTNRMIGVLTAYNSGTGAVTVRVTTAEGSGTYAAWTIAMAAGAPMAVASQTDAEAGTDNARVMTPLRTQQAIRSAQVPASIVSATSLTTTSLPVQVVNMPTRGLAVTLPDATTLASGRTFRFYNAGVYDLPIKDASGATKVFIRPGKAALATLSVNGVAAGDWLFDGGNVYGCTLDYIAPNALAGSFGDCRVIPVDGSRDMIVFLSNGNTLKCVVYDRSSNTFGAFATIQSASSVYQTVSINASTVLTVYGQGSTLTAVTVSISGTTATVNTPVSVASFMPSIENIWEATLVGTAWVFRAWSTSAVAEYAFAVTVSGTTPSIGGAVSLNAVPSNSYDPSSCFVAFAPTSSSILFFSAYNSGTSYIAVRYYTLSGNALTLASSFNAAHDFGQTPYKVEPLTTGRYLLLSTTAGVVYGTLVSVNGATASISAGLDLPPKKWT
ncbi:MAG: hypothetical protein KAG62_05700, partial [Caulobacter sp.]|nr:hypothetical protein [Caulobacter sp.]